MIDPRLDRAERHLDRMQSFFPRIDTKLTAVAAWLSVELGVGALNISWADLRSFHVWCPFAAYVAASLVAAVQLWRCVFPDSRGGQGSLIYFGAIAALKRDEFATRYKAVSKEDLLEDLIEQIWRNAQIVCDKYSAVQSAIRWASMSLALLILALIATSAAHQSLPKLPGS
jgi:hypothetical protein